VRVAVQLLADEPFIVFELIEIMNNEHLFSVSERAIISAAHQRPDQAHAALIVRTEEEVIVRDVDGQARRMQIGRVQVLATCRAAQRTRSVLC